MTTYGEQIKQRRLELGISQEELAKRVGYTDRSTIAKIETGVNDITVNKFVEIAHALSISPIELLGLEVENE